MASTSVIFEDPQDALEKESRAKITQIGEAYDEVVQGNRELEAMYKAEEDLMIKRLKEVQLELREIKRIRDENKNKPPKKDFIYSCYSAGKPYFKDSNFNQPPPNEDTKIMKQCDMYDFSTVMSVSGWNFGDTSNLRRVLLKTAQERETKRLYSELALLTRIKPKSRMIKTKIEEIMSDISNMKYKKFSDLDPSSYENFDWDEVALELNRHDRRHSAREYKSIWKLLLQPSVKMDKWSANEHLELQRLAREYNMQNWNAIAKELNIKRTGYQCFVYYRTNMDHAASGRRWTMEEMDRLRDVIIAHQEDYHIPWGKVAALMPNRTKVQCYNKYTRMMEQRKGRFNDEEDAVILNYVNVFDANYKNMVQFMYGRSSVQCRNRHNILKRPGPSATWTEEDDEKLLLAIANSDGPCTYASAARHFGPGKGRTHLRSRYHTLKKWIKKHPHSPTRNAPRRAPRRLAHGEPTTNLITALENLRRKINELTNEPTSQPKPKTNRLCRESSDAFINSALRTQITGHQIKLLLQENISKDTTQVRSSDTVNLRYASPRPGQDVYHLNLLLYILNTRIADKDKFQQSEYGQSFKDLEEMEKQGLVRKEQVIRSYSRKGISNSEPVVCPNLYSGSIAGRRKYLLPPNLATLTASRVILSHVHKQLQAYGACPHPPQPFDLKRTLRGKPPARAALVQLRERFNDLFLWPYNLSNHAPRYYSAMEQEDQKKRTEVPAKRHAGVPMPGVPMVTIPPINFNRRNRILTRQKNINSQPAPKEVINVEQKEISEKIAETEMAGTMMPETMTAGSMMPETMSAGSMLQETTSAGSMLQETTSAGSMLQETTSAGSMLQETSAGSMIPETMIAGSMMPETTSAGSMLQETTSAGSMLQETSAGSMMPETIIEESMMPETTSAGSMLQETSAGSMMPETTSAGSMLQETSAGSMIPETMIAGSMMPETMIAGSMLQETTSAGSMLQETTSAGSMLQETSAGSMMPETMIAGSMMPETTSAGSMLQETTSAGSMLQETSAGSKAAELKITVSDKSQHKSVIVYCQK